MISETIVQWCFPQYMITARRISFLAVVTASFFGIGTPLILAATLGNARALLRD